MQVCTSLQTDNHASTPPLCFLQAGCPSCRPTNSVKALKALYSNINVNISAAVQQQQSQHHKNPCMGKVLCCWHGLLYGHCTREMQHNFAFSDIIAVCSQHPFQLCSVRASTDTVLILFIWRLRYLACTIYIYVPLMVSRSCTDVATLGTTSQHRLTKKTVMWIIVTVSFHFRWLIICCIKWCCELVQQEHFKIHILGCMSVLAWLHYWCDSIVFIRPISQYTK